MGRKKQKKMYPVIILVLKGRSPMNILKVRMQQYNTNERKGKRNDAFELNLCCGLEGRLDKKEREKEWREGGREGRKDESKRKERKKEREKNVYVSLESYHSTISIIPFLLPPS